MEVHYHLRRGGAIFTRCDAQLSLLVALLNGANGAGAIGAS
jgi:hypothetical protein